MPKPSVLAGVSATPLVSGLGVTRSYLRSPGRGGSGRQLAGSSFTRSTNAPAAFTPGSTGGPNQGDPNWRYVNPARGTNGDGMSWATAFNALPTTLTRGLTYWLADGEYGARTFSAAPQGSTPITIKKATVASHGETVSGGWADTLGDGQAVFTGGWAISTSYWNFDGQVRNSNWHTGAINQYGIRVKTNGGRVIELLNAITNLNFTYCDAEGGGRDTGDAGSDVVYGLTGPANVTFSRCALHDSNRTHFLMRGGWSGLTVERCFIARNASHPAIHGEFMSLTDASNLVLRWNFFEDCEGTAVVAGINGGLLSGAQIYGNVFHWTAAYLANTGRDGTHDFGIAGIMFIADDASNRNSAENVKFYNNTIYQAPGSYSGVIIQKAGALGGNEVRNCIWDSCVRTNNSFPGTISHCWYRNTPVDGDTTATRQNGTSIPFVNAAAKDFHLAANTNAGFTLAAPYDVDMDGVARAAWSRGAFEMV